MATCHIYNTKGEETANVLFEGAPYAPDVKGTVVLVGGQVIGSIKSPHGQGEAKIYDSDGELIGSTEGFRSRGDRIAYADNLAKRTIGLVRKGTLIQRRPLGFGVDYDVGTIESDNWTDLDMEGLIIAADMMGRRITPKLLNLMQFKQRSLSGVAALLLNCV
jgi:hypothetical protein